MLNMKKVLLFVLTMPVFLFSCKKDSHTVNPINNLQKKYQVNYNLSGFTQQVHALPAKNPTLNSISTNYAAAGEQLTLHYYVYDSTGKLIRSVAEQSNTTSFPTITDSLAAGTYKVYFIAGGPDLELQPDGKQMTYPYPLPVYGTGPGWEDTFVSAMTLTVSGGNLQENVTLKRIVAELEVDITDPIPAQAQSLQIQVDNEYVYSYFDGTVETGTVSWRYAIFKPTATTKKYDLILFNTITPFNVDIYAYDASNNILGHALVTNVKCVKNARTVLTGGLFGNKNDAFTIALNDGWDPNPFTTIKF